MKSLLDITRFTPYYVVIFTSLLVKESEKYIASSKNMIKLVSKQKGFLGFESARKEVGITASYWKDLTSIKTWKEQQEHQITQKKGNNIYYNSYTIRIAKVEK